MFFIIFRALGELEAYHAGPASHLIDVLFGNAEVSPPTNIQPANDSQGTMESFLFCMLGGVCVYFVVCVDDWVVCNFVGFC